MLDIANPNTLVLLNNIRAMVLKMENSKYEYSHDDAFVVQDKSNDFWREFEQILGEPAMSYIQAYGSGLYDQSSAKASDGECMTEAMTLLTYRHHSVTNFGEGRFI